MPQPLGSGEGLDVGPDPPDRLPRRLHRHGSIGEARDPVSRGHDRAWAEPGFDLGEEVGRGVEQVGRDGPALAPHAPRFGGERSRADVVAADDDVGKPHEIETSERLEGGDEADRLHRAAP
jgi:hypothetical protein